MWKATSLAVGIAAVMLGLEALVIEQAVLTVAIRETAEARPFETMAAPGSEHLLTVPEWAPWSFLSTGAIVLLYTYTLPSRLHG